MLKAFKYRIYPNKEQRELLAKTFGSCRFVYNYYLDKTINDYNTEQRPINYVECAKNLKELKTELPWLKEVDSIALQQSLKDIRKKSTDFASDFDKAETETAKEAYSYNSWLLWYFLFTDHDDNAFQKSMNSSFGAGSGDDYSGGGFSGGGGGGVGGGGAGGF